MLKFSTEIKGKTIAVALSGGKDSMCLFNLLLKQKEQLNIKLKAVNIDHSIRGKESENDSLFVKNYCMKVGVELYFDKVDAVKFSNENGYSLEESARILRYEILDKILKQNYADYIATAHHLSDNFETVLLNLVRGTGIKGLSGIPEERKGIIRPLLSASRSEIDDYILKNNIPYVVDSTNGDINYTRNYIRNEIVPLIIKRFPSAENSAKRLSEIAREEDEFLTNLSNGYIEEKSGKFYVPLNLSPVIIKRATKSVLNKLGILKDYESVHLESIIKLTSLENGSRITLPKSVIAVKEYDKIAFFLEKERENYLEFPFSLGEIIFNGKNYKITDKLTKNALCFDGDKIPNGAVIRLRKEGDVFKKFGGGTKKLKDYLIDKKVPRFERDNIPVLAVDNQILLVFGVEINDDIKVTKTTKNILYQI